MGFFSKAKDALKKVDDLTAPKGNKHDPYKIDPEDLTLPDEIPTDKPGLTLKKAQGQERVDINIVGESFRTYSVNAVAKASEGKEFDMYLVAEPTNQYDKNAVAVFVANLQVGYIGKPDNKKWFTWVNEATGRGELLWGRGKAISREGTANTGIFGYINMPRQGKDIEDLIPKKLTPAEIAKAAGKVIDLSNIADDPETLGQLKSLCKKAVVAATPLAAHALWVEANPESQDLDKWSEIQSLCDDVLDTASEAAYATEPEDVDIVGVIEDLATEVQDLAQ